MAQVYIPYRERGVYGLLVVNFKENRFQQVYCGFKAFEDHPLDEIVEIIVSGSEKLFL